MGFSLVAPSTPAEAVRLLALRSEQTAVLAGGTDLLLDIEEGLIKPARVVSLRKLPWRSIRWRGHSLAVGALAALSALDEDSTIRERLPGLARAVHAVGSTALRQRATLGGNLGRASPASDLIPVLLVLDARVRLFGPEGRRELPVDDFVIDSRKTARKPVELIESVTIPDAIPCEYLWQRVRLANDVSQIGIAVAHSSEAREWRIALGGVPPRAIRLQSAERLLASESPSTLEMELAAQEAARQAPFVTDKRATEAYRRRLVYVLVKRAVESVAAQTPARPASSGRRPRGARDSRQPNPVGGEA